MTLLKLSAAALIVASLVASSGAIAATTTTKTVTKTTAITTHAVVPSTPFAMGKPTDVAALPDITGWMLKFDPAALKALDSAKSVTVFKYNKSWTGADKTKAAALLKTDRKSIDELRVAIAKDRKAESLLKAHHIRANQVVGVFDVKDAVDLYIL